MKEQQAKTDRSPVRPSILIVSAAVVAIGAAHLALAFFAVPDVVLWNVVRLAGVTLIAGLGGLAIGMGRPASGAAIGGICLAGAVGAGAVLIHIAAAPNVQTSPSWRSVAEYGRLASLACAGWYAVWAAAQVIVRGGGASVKRLAWGLGLCAPIALIGVASWWLYGPGLTAVSDPVRISVVVFGGAATIVLLSAAGHQLIMAFDRVQDA
ncbi:MAG: hypothetical protein CMJ31_09365 [Phycisphaerae bacterium]|nr:hypothetical protein [Phycisphaerae bacterium]